LIVVASFVVHCCSIKMNVIVASELFDVVDVQFTVACVAVESRLSLSLVASRLSHRLQTKAAVQPLWE